MVHQSSQGTRPHTPGSFEWSSQQASPKDQSLLFQPSNTLSSPLRVPRLNHSFKTQQQKQQGSHLSFDRAASSLLLDRDPKQNHRKKSLSGRPSDISIPFHSQFSPLVPVYSVVSPLQRIKHFIPNQPSKPRMINFLCNHQLSVSSRIISLS
ncbi:hypothetical protein PGTUg99_016041 [Puccinia graminis f. sp. tritici]|uniref:Uncharacterized protein n=1 Tax=Puccinia graminis f. sp. tritici TaxID=56615 RepID=A0A5B0S6P1_PUCGR|nr:hypothetical protein PGTUg99_016041 [Puccinia graminis f. sp. tritici]